MPRATFRATLPPVTSGAPKGGIMAGRLTGKVAIITGAAGGIGTDSVSVAGLVAATIARFGRLDICFANAGIGGGGLVADLPEETFDRVIGVNLKGAFLCAKHAVPHLLAAGGGALIFTASELALV